MQSLLTSFARDRRNDKGYYDDDDAADNEFYEAKFQERTDRQTRNWQRIQFASNNPYPMEYRSGYDQDFENEGEEASFQDSLNMIVGSEFDERDDDDSARDANNVGNFWVNPKKSLDPFPSPTAKSGRRRPLPNGEIPSSTAAPHERRPRSRNQMDDPRKVKRRQALEKETMVADACVSESSSSTLFISFIILEQRFVPELHHLHPF